MRATSNHTRYTELCTTPCASVSAKRTVTSVWKRKPFTTRHSTAVEKTVGDLAALVRERQPCVVLTGAGISTESGIPDFRSPTGIWANVDPFEVASIDAFRRDPERVWDFYRARIHMLLEAEPNRAHLAVAELERRELLAAVIT